MNYEKIYTVKINRCSKSGIWYQNKIGETFKAKLYGFTTMEGKREVVRTVFKVNSIRSILPVDCNIIGETRQIKKTYINID